jgi:hypothetical protein
MSDHRDKPDRLRPLALIALTATGVATGAALGAFTNLINGGVSPQYFRDVLDWHHLGNVWRASVAQGILEGTLFGLGSSVVFAAVVGCVSRVRCSYRVAAPFLFAITCAALVCWVVGGLLLLCLAFLSPPWFQRMFYGTYNNIPEMLGFAWVTGSIWGVELGGAASVIIASVIFFARWNTTGGRSKKVHSFDPSTSESRPI